MPSRTLIRVEMTYDNGDLEWLEGEGAQRWADSANNCIWAAHANRLRHLVGDGTPPVQDAALKRAEDDPPEITPASVGEQAENQAAGDRPYPDCNLTQQWAGLTTALATQRDAMRDALLDIADRAQAASKTELKQ